MRIRRIAFAFVLLSLTASQWWVPVFEKGRVSPSVVHSPQTAPLPSQLHTLMAAQGRW